MELYSMRISNDIHAEYPWVVREIAGDFELSDVWEFPIRADNSKTESFNSFCEVYRDSFKELPGLANFLFELRQWLGKVFGLDKNMNTLPIPGCTETSVRSRLSEKDEKKNHAASNDLPPFQTVYCYENERLDELSNDTVHALMHIGWVEKQDGRYTAQLAVYVKTRGRTGQMYMKLIEPFRHRIVYPAIMKMVKKRWEEYCGA